jgi:hypothetical protein
MTGEQLRQPSFIHPFDDPSFKGFLSNEHPEFLGRAESSYRPQTSESADELETWEAERIELRKQRFPHETDELYLRRLLYEESFSVNQQPDVNPPVTFQGVAGMTPGGLISHFYPRYAMNGVNLRDTLDTPELGMPNLAEALSAASQRRRLATIISTIMQPYALTGMRRYNLRLARDLEAGTGLTEEHNNVAFRMLKMFRAAPEMMKPVTDTQLQTAFVSHDKPIARAELIVRAWEKSQAILPNGYYTSAEAPEIKSAVNNLFMLRTHSEMQIFFKYLSPSGYINTQETPSGPSELR